ncbi:Phosphatidylinositol-4-phosphate 5-kinase [Dimargaris xerosporica]|nr:Phosphatidylinositol-4-phosphate 5-kinase [Dimargaris xerosporica]
MSAISSAETLSQYPIDDYPRGKLATSLPPANRVSFPPKSPPAAAGTHHRRTASDQNHISAITPPHQKSTLDSGAKPRVSTAAANIITLRAPRSSSVSPECPTLSPATSGDKCEPSERYGTAKAGTFPPTRSASPPDRMGILLQRHNTGIGEAAVVRTRVPGLGDPSDPGPGPSISRRNTVATPALEEPLNQGTDWLTAKQDLKKQRRVSRRRREGDVDLSRPTIGTQIDENHMNYVLMYNMLTGIRVAVSRCTGKVQRPLSSADFRAANKLAFDVTGDELTPSSRYDFKFKDYAPWVFRHIREAFRMDPADYLMSLTSKYILSEVGSAGKSGSFFYYSQDFRFIIKTIHHTEHRFMRRILPYYYEHVRTNPNTLVSRIYGLHRVKLPHHKKVHFVVMSNVFPPSKDIHETFDLKGSTRGRFLNEEEQQKPRAVFKDLNWMQMGRKIELGPVKRGLFIEQLERDVAFLRQMKIMDYSLLLGIHDMSRGNKDNIRDNTLAVFEPNADAVAYQPINRRSSKIMAMRKAIVQSDPVSLEEAGSALPDQTFKELRHCVFYQDSGGFRATDENNRPASKIYYMGVIDILTPYNMTKRMEHYYKAAVHDAYTISAVHPRVYAHRFVDFIIKTLQHHDDIPPLAPTDDRKVKSE